MNSLSLLVVLSTAVSGRSVNGDGDSFQHAPRQAAFADRVHHPELRLVAMASGDEDWEQKYQQLLKDRPEIRKKVETGGATKEQVIAWLKQGGDSKMPAAGKKKYATAKITVKDPAEFGKDRREIIYSGPQPGEALPALQVVGMTGPRRDQDFDPVALAQGKPQVLIFQDTDGATLKSLYFLGPVLERIKQKSKGDLEISVILLSDDRSNVDRDNLQFYQKRGASLQFAHTLDGFEGPGVYGLNRNVDITILTAKDGKVVRNLVFPEPVFEANPYVLGAVAELIGENRQTVAGWFEN